MATNASLPSTRVCVYFVASPLQYLAARRIALDLEAGRRQLLFYYKKGVAPIVRPEDWEIVRYLSWPRFEPLDGPFGRHRRLRWNLRLVADLVGPCESLTLHSAVFDSEVTNYFLKGLPRLTGARAMQARILPDGLISIRRYPLSSWKRLLQGFRKLRRLVSPELDYWCFSGDRIGSDAPFVDRIYTLHGFPHQYPADKVSELPPLIAPMKVGGDQAAGKRALVLGQPLTGFGLMTPQDRDETAARIHDWLVERRVGLVHYKAHPKDPKRELMHSSYQPLILNEPIETHMSRTHYDFVVGVRSSALVFARQIYGADTQVAAFGWDRVRFKSPAEREDMRRVFSSVGIELL